jgi:hypothetical protein
MVANMTTDDRVAYGTAHWALGTQTKRWEVRQIDDYTYVLTMRVADGPIRTKRFGSGEEATVAGCRWMCGDTNWKQHGTE